MTLAERTLGNLGEPGWTALFTKPRTLRFYETFGESRIVESRFSWAEWARARRPGLEPPNPLGTTERPAIPVLSPRAGATDGMLLSDAEGSFLWVRAGKPAKPVSLGQENANLTPLTAIARDKDELVVLAGMSSCGSRVISITSAGARILFEIPGRPTRQACAPHPDALAAASDGTLVVLRFPSSEPATADDPALAMALGTPPVPLAPWSALQADPCPAGAAYRALVAPTTAWLGLELPGADLEESPAFMLVRWGAQNVCLEATELASGEVGLGDQALATSVMARFGSAPQAARRGFAMGAESVQPLTCRLATN